MFYDNNSSTRESWKYTYTGQQLIEPARAKRDLMRQKELSSRKSMAELLNNQDVRQDDERVSRLRQNIADYGKQYEACCVYYVEFSRTPCREFHLSLGDVVYFDVV